MRARQNSANRAKWSDWSSAKVNFVLIFLCFVSFHQGKEMKWSLRQSLIESDNRTVIYKMLVAKYRNLLSNSGKIIGSTQII